MSDLIATARSLLFVPGHRPDRYAKALASGADAVIIDLEDAVPPSAKGDARDALAAAWPGLSAETRARTLVRMNARDTEFANADLALMHKLRPVALIVPKSEDAADLHEIATMLGTSTQLVPMIETAAGLSGLRSIARTAQVLRLAFGNIDFQADLGMNCGEDETLLSPVRFELVLESRLARLAAPIDGVTLRTDDAAAVEAAARGARRAGLGGKLCIHPAQVAPVHAAYAPSAAEIDWARRVVAASEAAKGGACRLDGRMIDRPVLLLAQHTLAIAESGR